MGIRDDQLDGGLCEAFKPLPGHGDSVLEAIHRLHGTKTSILLRETDEDVTPVLLRRERDEAQDDRRYRIRGEIARGGIGVIYRGHDKDLNRDVALKVLRPDYADRDDVIQRFVEEAQIGGQLQHPGIVPVYGIGLQPDGRPSFAMKLIKGRTLAELLDQNPQRIDLLAVFEQVAQTIAYAHSRGVIHRDLKPANVMVGAFGEVQVVDWGFAKILGHEELEPRPEHTVIETVRTGAEGSQSIAGSVMGTPAYMPPEQAMGRIADLDERSDVFALGAILCEILTGQPPYSGEQKDQLVAAVQCRLDPAMERLAKADAAEGLKDIVRACLQPLTADRPRKGQALADRLTRHFATVEGRARQSELDAVESEAQAARERDARRRAVVLATAALVSILAGGGGYFAWKRGKDLREANAAPRIAGALRQATSHEGDQDWSAAVAAAREAVDIAASEGVDDAGAGAMLARLERAREAADEAARLRAADEALLAQLEEARALATDHYSAEEIDRAYRAALESRWPSGEVDSEQLAASPFAREIASAFDAWAAFRRAAKIEGRDWQQVDAWARATDPEQNALRDAVAARDSAELEKLAGEFDFDTLPAARATYVARALRVSGKLKQALALLQRTQRLHPDNFWVHYQLGLTATPSDWELAARHFQTALALRPRSVEARHRLGIALRALGDLEGARTVWQDALALRPDWNHGYRHLVEVMADQRKFGEAIRYFEDQVKRRPNWAAGWQYLGVALLRRGRFEGAVKAFHHAMELAPDDNALLGYCHGNIGHGQMILRRDYEAAITSLQKSIELAPQERLFRFYLANLLMRMRDWRRAAVHFQEQARRYPREWTPWRNLAIARTGKGDFDGALAAWRKVAERKPGRAIMVANHLCDNLRHYDDAIAEFKRIQAARPDEFVAYGNMGVAYRNKRDYARAIAAHKKCAKMAPDNAPQHSCMGRTLELAGEFESALQAHRKALQIDSSLEESRESVQRIEKLLAWEKRLPEVLDNGTASLTSEDRATLGWLLLCKKQFAVAARFYREAFAGDPSLTAFGRTHSYSAIRAAARAGAAWHAQALAWLRDLLATLRTRADAQPSPTLADLLFMRADPDLASIRDRVDLSEEWKRYWADHDALIAHIQEEATK